MENKQLEINLEEFDKEILIELISFAHKYNLTFNEAIVKLLTEHLNNFKYDENQLPLL